MAIQFVSIQQAKTALSVFILLLFIRKPLMQLALISVCQILPSVIVAVVRPSTKRHENLKEILTNFMLALIMTTSAVFTPELGQGISPNSLYNFWGYLVVV